MYGDKHFNIRRGRLWDSKPAPSKDCWLTDFVNERKQHAGYNCQHQFTCVCFNDDGTIAALADKRRHVFLLYVEGNRYSELACMKKPISALAFTKTEPIQLMIACFKHIEIFDTRNYSNVTTLCHHAGPVIILDTMDGYALSASYDCAVLWNVKDWSFERKLQGDTSIQFICFSTTGELIGALFVNSRINIWTTDQGKLIEEIGSDVIGPLHACTSSSDNSSVSFTKIALNSKYLVACGVCRGVSSLSVTSNSTPFPAALDISRDVTTAPHPGTEDTTKPLPYRPPPYNSSPALLVYLHGARRVLNLAYPCSRIISISLQTLKWNRWWLNVAFILMENGTLQVIRLKTLHILLTFEADCGSIINFAVAPTCRYLLYAISDGSCQIRDVHATMNLEWKRCRQRLQSGMSHTDIFRILDSAKIDVRDEPSDEMKSNKLDKTSEITDRHRERGEFQVDAVNLKAYEGHDKQCNLESNIEHSHTSLSRKVPSIVADRHVRDSPLQTVDTLHNHGSVDDQDDKNENQYYIEMLRRDEVNKTHRLPDATLDGRSLNETLLYCKTSPSSVTDAALQLPRTYPMSRSRNADAVERDYKYTSINELTSIETAALIRDKENCSLPESPRGPYIQDNDPVWLPLYDMLSIPSSSKELSPHRLKLYLYQNESFPMHLRPLIYRYFLQLPINREEFEKLSGCVASEGDHDVHSSVYSQLHSIRTALYKWSPELEGMPFIPLTNLKFVEAFVGNQ